jgi:two-component system response regulator/two-component system chemotaxis response regulator CheY
MAKILIIDDIPFWRDLASDALCRAGHEVATAENGVDGLGALERDRAELVILDVEMPEMAGFTLLERMRQREEWRHIPVVMLTGAMAKEDILRARSLGAVEYLIKSRFSLDGMIERVNRRLVPHDALPPHLGGSAHSSGERHAAGHAGGSPHGPATSQGPAPHFASAAAAPASTHPEFRGENATDDNRLLGALGRTANPERGPALPPSVHVEIPRLLTRDESLARTADVLRARSLSGVVAEIMELAASGDAAISDIAAAVARDPVIAGRVLQASNAANNATAKGHIASLEDAIKIIGCSAVRDLAATIAVFDAMPHSDRDGFNLLRCWQHAFAVARICNSLAGKGDLGTAYLIGLCHDLGEIMFRSQFADEYQKVLDVERLTGRKRADIERHMLGVTQRELADMTLRSFHLPESVRAPIMEHHDSATARPGHSAMARLLRVADLYANGLMLASSTRSPVSPVSRLELRAATGREDVSLASAASLRADVLAMTGALARFPDAHQAEATASPYVRRPIRVWLARDSALSPVDPVAAALGALAELTCEERLPTPREASEHSAVVVMARSSNTEHFTAAEVEHATLRPDGHRIPLLWLVAHVDSAPMMIKPLHWPVPLSAIAAFISAA